MMKKKLLIFSFILLLCFCIGGSSVLAEEPPAEDTTEEKPKKNGLCFTYGFQTDEYYQCLADRKATVQTSGFIASALYSMDDVLRGKEIAKQPDYVKYFFNSSMTAIAYSIDILDPETFLMHLIGLLIVIVESIGSMITLVVMVIFNASSTSFWQSTIRGIFDIVDNLIFDWNNPNSIFMKFVILFGLIAIFQRIIKQFKRVFGVKDIMMIVLSTVFSIALVLGVARFGKPIMDQVENTANTFITDTFTIMNESLASDSYGENVDYEIGTKAMIFEVMQAQGFRLRHFGVTSTDQIKAPSTDYAGDFLENLSGGVKDEQRKAKDDWNTDKAKQQETRYRTILEDPGKDSAQRERKVYGSTDVIYNFPQAIVVLVQSVIFFVHKLLMAIVIGIGCLLALMVSLLKEVLLSVSIYALAKCILSPDKKSTLMWFFNRFQWLLLSFGTKFVLTLLIFIVISSVNAVSQAKFGLLVIVPFDVFLVFMMMYAIKNAPRLMQKVLATLDADGGGFVSNASRFLGGNGTPKEMFDRAKENFGHKNDNDNDSSGKSNEGSDGEGDNSNEDDQSSLNNINDKYDSESTEEEKSSDGELVDGETVDGEENAKIETEKMDEEQPDEEDFDINKEFEQLQEKESSETEAEGEKTSINDVEDSLEEAGVVEEEKTPREDAVEEELNNTSLNSITDTTGESVVAKKKPEKEDNVLDYEDMSDMDDFYKELMQEESFEDEDSKNYL